MSKHMLPRGYTVDQIISDDLFDLDRKPRVKRDPAAHALFTVNPLDDAEIFAYTAPGAPVYDVHDLIPHLPAEWEGARFHRFESNPTNTGMFVLRMDVPADHTGQVDTCSACDAYRAARLDLVLPVAVDEFIADALGGAECDATVDHCRQADAH